ncbi:hypothetical protein IWX90DRAFT_306833 [Phyllosticta citrichinensis]|uniref:Signal recognition particle subunit SRP68 n=1 Tax=Phyllosticta citrichinensis TaxID=1130410 RepID=A0ABR1XLM8_9PEZI
MDIAAFVASQRDSVLLLGDYNTYRQQLSRRLLTLRRRLGRATPKNAKYSTKDPVTASDIGSSHDFVQLQILTAERAWAHAMHMRSLHAEDNAQKGITGTTRKHIISRLHKAAVIARDLSLQLSDQAASGATDIDILEAKAYYFSLCGAQEFEKQAQGQPSNGTTPPEQRWQGCLVNYSAARIIYNALLQSTKNDIFKDILTNTVDPSLRYAAYQSRLPRTITVAAVACQRFPRTDSELVNAVEKVYPDALQEESQGAGKGDNASTDIPTTIVWRSRTANIVDASIGQSLAQVATAEAKLSAFLKTSAPETTLREKAAAYDDVLIASQDAADATRRAIEELEKEGVNEGDSQMQHLRITSLAVNYTLIGWRVGRNRVLIGGDDGATINPGRIKKVKSGKEGKEIVEKEEGTGRKLASLRERVVLFDSILQSIDSVKELRGAMRDSDFIQELDGKRAYFQALKCLNIAYSHALLSSSKNALALFARALDLSNLALSTGTDSSETSSKPSNLEISIQEAKSLHSRAEGLVTQYRALADLQKLTKGPGKGSSVAAKTPLVQRLEQYPAEEANLKNLVEWPPRLQTVPVKPMFLDVAFNYIDYPGRSGAAATESGGGARVNEAPQGATEEKPKSRGWFGFGR